MQKHSKIYVFVNKNTNVSPEYKILYVGSSNQIHKRIVNHVEAITTSKSPDVYQHIISKVGADKFDILLLDGKVPGNLQFTYERLYYNILVSQGFHLQNLNKPIPEDKHLVNDFFAIKEATDKLSQFTSRLFDVEGYIMSDIELIMNELKKEAIKRCKTQYEESDATRLKAINKQNRIELNKIKTENAQLRQRVNDIGQINMLLKNNVDLHQELRHQSVHVRDNKTQIAAAVNKEVKPKNKSSPVRFMEDIKTINEDILYDIVVNDEPAISRYNLYQQYMEWCRKNGAKIEVHNRFFPQVDKFIEDSGKNRINKKQIRWVTLNSTTT